LRTMRFPVKLSICDPRIFSKTAPPQLHGSDAPY
jgi:hypothetical protein